MFQVSALGINFDKNASCFYNIALISITQLRLYLENNLSMNEYRHVLGDEKGGRQN